MRILFEFENESEIRKEALIFKTLELDLQTIYDIIV